LTRFIISLKVYDLLGREVAKLLNEEKEKGTYQVDFDGGKMPSGIYICRMTTSKFADTIKMLLLK